MKKITLLITVLISSLSFASEIRPIAVSKNNKPIIACYHKNITRTHAYETVVLRNNKSIISSSWVNHLNENMMIALKGEKTPTTRGITGMYLQAEGTTTLLDAPGETWTVPSPEGTFLTARGNFVGFFLIDNGSFASGKLVKNEWTHNDEMDMTCTDDLDTAIEWVKAVEAYIPF